MPATWSGFCFCTGRGRRGRGGPETGRGHQAGNECVVLSVVFPSPVCYWFGPVRPQLLPLQCWPLYSSSSYRAGARERLESRRPRVREGEERKREEGKNFRLGESKWRRSVRWGGPPRRCSRRERTPTPPRRPARSLPLPTTQQSAGGRGSAGREQNVGQLEPSSISETGWQLKEGGRREEKEEDAQQGRKEGGRGKGSCVAVEEDSKRAKPTTTTR